jgi:hypothetical protein
VPQKTVAQKGHIKPGATIAVVNRQPGVVESLGLHRGVEFVAPAKADVVLLFVLAKAELEARMPKTVAALRADAALWVFFRKGSRGAGLDMNRDSVWAVADALGMRPLGIVGVDDAWSAFRLRPGAQGDRKAR